METLNLNAFLESVSNEEVNAEDLQLSAIAVSW